MPEEAVTVAGIDFAAAPERTAIVRLRWTKDTVLVEDAVKGADDDAVIAAIRESEASGVDVPFGWPDGFVDFVSAHRDGPVAAPADSGRGWRRTMTYRATDLEVVDWGLQPLSVSADRIAHAALRWAAIAARMAQQGMPVARDGSDGVFEVYPAASLHSWEIGPRYYKGADRAEVRAAMLEEIESALRAVDWGAHRAAVATDEDLFDALVCALTAQAAHVGFAIRSLDREKSRREGWIHVPVRVLSGIRPDNA